jgi:hypothetical protein
VTCSELIATWLVAAGTLILAAVAVFQDTIRGWFYHPAFRVSIKTAPPDCGAIPITNNGVFVANSIYLRLWVENVGNATARNAEIYASELRRRRLDQVWEKVSWFPPMNLKWAHIGVMYFPTIAAGMGKHCDLGHITDPTRRNFTGEDAPQLALTVQQTSLAFDLIVSPNSKSHIIGPGEYELDILVAAENVRPIKRTITISLRGMWDPDETKMLRDGIGVSVL